MPTTRSDLLAGTLEMLVLRTLTVQSLHGYAIAQHIAKIADGVLQVEPGTLNPARGRLPRKGVVKATGAGAPEESRGRC